MLRRCLAAAAAVATLVPAAACGGGDKSAAAADVNRVEQIPVRLTVKLRGDVNLTIDNKEVKSTFVVRRSTNKDQENDQVVGVESVEPVATDGMLVIAGFSIVPFKGDGKYTVKEGSPVDAVKEQEEAQKTGKARQRSSMKVEWWPGSDVTGETFLFMRREKECKATVAEEGTKGHVFCPVIVDEAKTKRFSFDFSWDVP